MPSGAIDFGGPALTFALMCARKSGESSYLDLIASGTITHADDDKSEVILYQEPLTQYYCMRPVGFRSFSTPTAVITGTTNGGIKTFEGSVRLEVKPAVAGGVSLARNDRSLSALDETNHIDQNRIKSNRSKALELLTTPVFSTSPQEFEAYDRDGLPTSLYLQRSPRVYVQQVSPLSRGTSRMEFNGNSILGGNIASFNASDTVKNPLYVTSSVSLLPSEYTTKIATSNFAFEAVSCYTLVDSRQSPYLMLPGDKLTLAISKTRPVIYAASAEIGQYDDPAPGHYNTAKLFGDYYLTGSHETVKLNVGSINVTLYGSYVREGMEYHP
jgi:hypothetical protein